MSPEDEECGQEEVTITLIHFTMTPTPIPQMVRSVTHCRKIVSSVMSVCPSARPSAWNNWAPVGWIFTKFDYFSRICREQTRKIQVSLKSEKTDGTVDGDVLILR